MPLPAIAISAYYAALQAAPAVAPAVGAALLGIGIANLNDPTKLDTVQLTTKAEPAAECMRQNVAALNSRLVAAVQPLQGTETMGVVIKRGIVGDPLMTIIIQDALSGSTAELRPISESFPDLIPQVMRGC
jgi:hypothetical protein